MLRVLCQFAEFCSCNLGVGGGGSLKGDSEGVIR